MATWRDKTAAETRATQARTAQQEEVPVVIPACREMEAHPEEKEPASVDRKPEAAELREVPFEDAEVMPVGEPKKRRRF
ncbi:hypothetical protein B7P43_G02145 [Cryptotermes secundus]|uniref:Uncharacterized protein n=1 Tax=Cryptotermes secundus TaxID=105785 RepID=A0A2J7PY29_9NEOP|nr:hypothetical protein B7P43_G02145 [Cryptotermes secundus]